MVAKSGCTAASSSEPVPEPESEPERSGGEACIIASETANVMLFSSSFLKALVLTSLSVTQQ